MRIRRLGSSLLGALAMLAVLGSSAALAQTTIVEVSGTPSEAVGLFYETGAAQWVGATWSQTFSATNVAISAPLGFFLPEPNPVVRTGTAYLTRQTGPGTTVASEVARAIFQVPAVTTYAEVRLFSGLTLGPGTYFLILVATQGGGGTGWIATANPTITLAAGVALNRYIFVNDDTGILDFSYPPASTFVPSPDFDPNIVMFKVFVETPTTQTLTLAVTQIASLGSGERNSLLAKLNAAQESLAAQNYAVAINQLSAFINQVEAFRRSRRLDAATADSLIATARAIVATIS